MNDSARTVLILGARGRFGAAAASAFTAAGWRVLAQARGGEFNNPLADTAELARRAAGARVVVYGVNPLFTRWATEMLPLARAGMAVAERLEATFVLPGNVYAFGESMPPRLTESTAERPSTEKGRLRQALEAELQQRAASGALRSVVLRAGDFFGAGRGGWLDLVIAKRLANGRLTYPGPLEVPHAWAYLPDLAQACVAVAERAADGALPAHTRLHFEGHTLTGAQLLDGLEEAAASLGLPKPMRRSRMPWWPMRAAGVVVPMLRELSRMAYLWHVPHALDGAALERSVGRLPHTPTALALRASLESLGFGAPAAGVRAVRGAAA